jgi:hypothetical protein
MQVDAIGGARHDDGAGGDNEVQRTMLEIVNQLDGFDSRGNIKVGAPGVLVRSAPGGALCGFLGAWPPWSGGVAGVAFCFTAEGCLA